MSIDLKEVCDQVAIEMKIIDEGAADLVATMKWINENQSGLSPLKKLVWRLVAIIAGHPQNERWKFRLAKACADMKNDPTHWRITHPEPDDSLFHCLGYAIAEAVGIRNSETNAQQANGTTINNAGRIPREAKEKPDMWPVGHINRLDLRAEPGEDERVTAKVAKLRASDDDGLYPWEKAGRHCAGSG